MLAAVGYWFSSARWRTFPLPPPPSHEIGKAKYTLEKPAVGLPHKGAESNDFGWNGYKIFIVFFVEPYHGSEALRNFLLCLWEKAWVLLEASLVIRL
jgi:hypothetical protein